MDLPLAADLFSPWIFGAGLIALRFGAVLLFVPMLGQSTTPSRIRVLLVLFVAIIISMSFGGLRVEIPTDLFHLLGVTVREVLIGAGMGVALRLVFGAIESAGSVAGLSMALSFDQLLDPQTGENSSSLGALLGVTSGLIFVAMNGHHVIFRTLHEHIRAMPPGELSYAAPELSTIMTGASNIAEQAVILASPVVVVGLLINLAITLAARVVPSLNVFAVGLGLLTLTGLLSMGFMGDSLVAYFERHIDLIPQLLFDWGGGE